MTANQTKKLKVAMMKNKGTVKSSDRMMIKLCSEPLSLSITQSSHKNNSRIGEQRLIRDELLLEIEND